MDNRRLHDFANSLGLPFEFTPNEGKIGKINSNLTAQLGFKISETIVVYRIHHYIYDITGDDFDTLQLLTLLKYKPNTIVEQDLSHDDNFLGRKSRTRGLILGYHGYSHQRRSNTHQDPYKSIGFPPWILCGT